VLGRTNRAFPPVWLSLALPREPDTAEAMAQAALESGAPIDITAQPALWGQHLRGHSPFLTCVGARDFEHANDEQHAFDLTSAHLIQTLSSLGRESLDTYFVPVRRAVEEYQINGVLQALETARHEGHITHFGVCCNGPALATLGMWQFHDAFELLLVPRNHHSQEAYKILAPMAKERRVGVVTSQPLNWGFGVPFVNLPAPWQLRNLAQSFYGCSLAQAAIADLAQDNPVMVGVRSVEEIRQAVAAATIKTPDGLQAYLEPYLEAFDANETWAAYATSLDPAERQSARKREMAQR